VYAAILGLGRTGLFEAAAVFCAGVLYIFGYVCRIAVVVYGKLICGD